MILHRREFVRLVGGAALGGIFVPKFERWFRANHVWQAEPIVFPISSRHYDLGWTSRWTSHRFQKVYETPLREYNALVSSHWQRGESWLKVSGV